jgi:phage-related protein
VWGFYSSKKKKYFAPVNSSTVGKEVDFKNTRNYTSMPIKQSPLDAFFI